MVSHMTLNLTQWFNQALRDPMSSVSALSPGADSILGPWADSRDPMNVIVKEVAVDADGWPDTVPAEFEELFISKATNNVYVS
jgi:hypothetical protein